MRFKDFLIEEIVDFPTKHRKRVVKRDRRKKEREELKKQGLYKDEITGLVGKLSDLKPEHFVMTGEEGNDQIVSVHDTEREAKIAQKEFMIKTGNRTAYVDSIDPGAWFSR